MKSWGAVVDFRKGGKVKKEDFDRDIPYETSKSWGTLQGSVPGKKKESENTKTLLGSLPLKKKESDGTKTS